MLLMLTSILRGRTYCRPIIRFVNVDACDCLTFGNVCTRLSLLLDYTELSNEFVSDSGLPDEINTMPSSGSWATC